MIIGYSTAYTSPAQASLERDFTLKEHEVSFSKFYIYQKHVVAWNIKAWTLLQHTCILFWHFLYHKFIQGLFEKFPIKMMIFGLTLTIRLKGKHPFTEKNVVVLYLVGNFSDNRPYDYNFSNSTFLF